MLKDYRDGIIKYSFNIVLIQRWKLKKLNRNIREEKL